MSAELIPAAAAVVLIAVGAVAAGVHGRQRPRRPYPAVGHPVEPVGGLGGRCPNGPEQAVEVLNGLLAHVDEEMAAEIRAGRARVFVPEVGFVAIDGSVSATSH